MNTSASVIISFYNKIEFLKLLLAGFSKQTFKDFEIIIADDGSNNLVVKEIETILPSYPFPILHIHQPDNGFRKNKILNKAITSSSAEYIIFVDGDCVPHPKFVEEHFRNSKRNVVLTGRRVNLSKKITSKLTAEKVISGYLQKQFFAIALDGLFGKSTDVEKGLYVTNKMIAAQLNKKKRGILGCNFSLQKQDLLEVNGFDERYEAPSIGEDSDIQFRLELLHKEIRSLNNLSVQYHLYHKLQPRPTQNLDLFEIVKQNEIAYTKYGICKNISGTL